MGSGYLPFTKEIVPAFARISERLPAILVDSLREQWARVQAISEEIGVWSGASRTSSDLASNAEALRGFPAWDC
ncbi:hypothetical protein QF000_000715 [Paraburkholderia atlantica]|uniref:Uncharacterized protein n=2 Tax=Paraburkholderia TaxID=1822464 RepID=A0A7W8P8I2_9BURK|nr:hypothetical protein [Paraburkholderia youngii]MBB5421391.1 hypothetical protein [Paraburkholderia atlantica]MBB5429455.1 hypothetical protein [Paraburkholderia atlantica]